MKDFRLINKLRDLCKGDATLLWLEGAQHNRVLSFKLNGEKLILNLADSTIRIVNFDKYAITAVGLQFWHQGHPSVLYRWDHVPNWTWNSEMLPNINNDFSENNSDEFNNDFVA